MYLPFTYVKKKLEQQRNIAGPEYSLKLKKKQHKNTILNVHISVMILTKICCILSKELLIRKK
jgi:hypothetical protein